MDVTLGLLQDIPPGEGRAYEVAGMRIAVFHTRTGGLYAVQAECPHRQGPLADGIVGGTTLVCPLHSWKFDLTTGHAIDGKWAVETYAVHCDAEGRVVLAL